MDFQNSDGGAGGANAGTDVSDIFGGAGGGDGGQGSQGSQGDGGQGGQGGQGDGSQGDGGAADPDWYGNLSADVVDGETASNRDWIKAKGFKDLDGLTKALRSAERAIHDSGRVKIPGEGASAEELATFRKAIGVPDDAKGYGMPVPMGSDGQPLKGPDGEPVKLNGPLLERLAGVAHRLGVPKAAYEGFVQDFVQSQLEDIGRADATAQEEARAKMGEWGAQAPARMQDVNRGVAALGLGRDEVLAVRAALGAGRAMDILQKLGAGLAEDTMLASDGSSQRFGVSASEAQAQIEAMKKDPQIRDKILVPGSAENERWKRLQAVVQNAAARQATGS